MTHCLFKVGWKRLRFHQRTDLCACHGQRAHVFGVQRIQHGVDVGVQAGVRQKNAKRVGGGGKTGRHLHARGAGGQLGDHLAEAGVFAAHGFHVGHPQVFKRHHQSGGLKQVGH